MAPKISGVLGSIGYPAPFHRLSEIDTDKVDARGEGEGVRRLEGEGARSMVKLVLFLCNQSHISYF